MSRGRKRGFCGVLATQRISALHKSALAEAHNKLIGVCSLDDDMKRGAFELGFDRAKTLSLRDLEPGTFYSFGPASQHRLLTQLATPKGNENSIVADE